MSSKPEKPLILPLFASLVSTDRRWFRLDQIAEVIDCPHSTPVLVDDASAPYVVRSQDMRSGTFMVEQAGRVSEETYQDRIARAEPQFGDLLYSREGTYFGIAAEVPRLTRVCLGQRMVLIRPKSENVDHRFLRYWLNSPQVFGHIHGFRDGTVAERLNLPTIRGLAVALPPLRDQQSIGELLGALDDRIALLRESNATLEAIAQALFKSWFVDFDPVHARARGELPEGLSPEVAALFPDSVEESALGMVPKGWNLIPLEKAYEINPTRKLKKGESASYLDMASVATSGHTVSGVIERAMGSGSKFINGDTLLARITPCLENGKTAFVDFLLDEQTGWGSTEFVVLRPKAPLPPYHGYLLSRYPAFREHAIQSMSGTSGRQRVQNDVLGRYPTIVPTTEIAMAFDDIVSGVQRKIAANHQQAQTLATLRDTLLPRLISGQLRLPDIQSDEIRG